MGDQNHPVMEDVKHQTRRVYETHAATWDGERNRSLFERCWLVRDVGSTSWPTWSSTKGEVSPLARMRVRQGACRTRGQPLPNMLLIATTTTHQRLLRPSASQSDVCRLVDCPQLCTHNVLPCRMLIEAELPDDELGTAILSSIVVGVIGALAISWFSALPEAVEVSID